MLPYSPTPLLPYSLRDGFNKGNKMVIEWLKYRVEPQNREKFIEVDRETWTATLVNYPGFLGKEIWINPEIPSEIVLIVRWESSQPGSAIPAEVLQATDKKFIEKMGENEYKMLESFNYQVRQFPSV